jgi:hypothetical protein
VLRYCKKCSYGPFVKDDGCNRVKCLKCGYQHCFICGQEVTSYPDHFRQSNDTPGTSGYNRKCVLFDNTEARLAAEADLAEGLTVQRLFGEGEPEIDGEQESDRELALRLQIQETARAPTRRDLEGRRPASPEPQRLLPWRWRAHWHVLHVLTVLAILGLTIALLRTRPPEGTDRSLFIVIIFTNVISLIIKLTRWDDVFDDIISFILGGGYWITMWFYLGEAIAFAVKLGRPYSCANVHYISNNNIIAGSQLRCKLARADTFFLFLGECRVIYSLT